MVSESVAEREVRSLCKEILQACQQLPEGPTTTDVRATSSTFAAILRRIWCLCAPAGGSFGSASKLLLFLVKDCLVQQILTFLLWSSPLLPSELSVEPQGAAYRAWRAAANILMCLTRFGSRLAMNEREPLAAGSALLEQLQPAYDLSKPGG